MVVGMCVIRRTALSIPMRRHGPGLSAVARAMQVDAATDDLVGVGRVHSDRVAVRHLPFLGKVIAGHVDPAVAAVTTPEHTENVVVLTCRIGAYRVVPTKNSIRAGLIGQIRYSGAR